MSFVSWVTYVLYTWGRICTIYKDALNKSYWKLRIFQLSLVKMVIFYIKDGLFCSAIVSTNKRNWNLEHFIIYIRTKDIKPVHNRALKMSPLHLKSTNFILIFAWQSTTHSNWKIELGSFLQSILFLIITTMNDATFTSLSEFRWDTPIYILYKNFTILNGMSHISSNTRLDARSNVHA